MPGGQLMITTEVENYPGFPEGITGPELMERFQKQAERFGTRIHMENVVKVDFSQRPFLIQGESVSYRSETVIISTGASAKWLGVKGEDSYKNRGVTACATCDGAFFKKQDVLVVGGGDTAMEEATYLAKIVNKVTLLHRRDTFRASKIMQERVLKNPKISGDVELGGGRGGGQREGDDGRGGAQREDERHPAARPPRACSSPSATRPTRTSSRACWRRTRTAT